MMTKEEQEKHRLAFRPLFATTGHDTLKALLIVSGGAAVAYLTFLGATFGQEGRFKSFGPDAAFALVMAMRYYIFSVAAALLCYGFTWFSHGSYYFDFQRTGHVTMAIAVLFGLSCLCLFLFGSLEAASAFAQAAKHLKP
jgi:hypothetical protein